VSQRFSEWCTHHPVADTSRPSSQLHIIRNPTHNGRPALPDQQPQQKLLQQATHGEARHTRQEHLLRTRWKDSEAYDQVPNIGLATTPHPELVQQKQDRKGQEWAEGEKTLTDKEYRPIATMKAVITATPNTTTTAPNQARTDKDEGQHQTQNQPDHIPQRQLQQAWHPLPSPSRADHPPPSLHAPLLKDSGDTLGRVGRTNTSTLSYSNLEHPISDVSSVPEIGFTISIGITMVHQFSPSARTD
jgi:hypothetical protein